MQPLELLVSTRHGLHYRAPRLGVFWLIWVMGHRKLVGTKWGPEDSVQLRYQWLNYGLWYL